MKERLVNLATFRKLQKDMIAKNGRSWDENYGRREVPRIKSYDLEEVNRIINSASLSEQQKMSVNFFNKDGFYKRLITYYATILTYSGILIPIPSFGKKLSTINIGKKYNSALEYLDKLNTPELLTNISIKALIYGAYYGVIKTINSKTFTLIDLPSEYCCSRFKDIYGNDIVEFDVTYFNTILDNNVRDEALKAYPKIISHYYYAYLKGRETSRWIKLPSEMGVCFSFFDENRPFFLNVIPATLQYDESVDTEREREKEEIRKILVQKIPHLNDGQLLFEPDEAVEMHAGAVGMMKGNKNLSILTTYADVDAIVSKTSADNNNSTLERMLQNVYSEAGTSAQVFAPVGTQALGTSITNDMALMMILANKYSRFITFILNQAFGNQSLTFKYTILPINYYNRTDYITDAFKLAQSGYSYLLPSLALGINQRDLINIKDLENDVLGLAEKLIPLSSAYTQSSSSNEEGGAPEKKPEDKSLKTIQNENAIDTQGIGGTNG